MQGNIKIPRALFLLLLYSAIFAECLEAQNIVKNGDFKAFNSVAYWDTPGFILIQGGGVDDGAYVGFTQHLSQTLSTKPGQEYELKFSIRGYAEGVLQSGPLALGVDWGSQSLGTFSVVNGSQTWITERLLVSASDTQTTLKFISASGEPWLDGVSVVAIPEPSSLALLIFGLAMVCVRLLKY